MNELLQHPRVIIEAIVVYWLFSAVVGSMPKPPATSYWGTWLYGALHLFAGNLAKFAEAKLQALANGKTEETKKEKE